jgi:hypothetical protein
MLKSPSPPAALSHEQADADLRLGDDAALAALRLRALELADGNDWSRYEDHEVVAQLAAAQTQGRGGASPAPAGVRLFRLAPAPEAAAPSPPAPAPSPRAAAAAVPLAAETTFGLGLDVAAMVAVLRQAAQDGTPFCEECARAAAAQRAAA